MFNLKTISCNYFLLISYYVDSKHPVTSPIITLPSGELSHLKLSPHNTINTTGCIPPC